MPSIASSRPRQLLPNLWVILPQHSTTPQPGQQPHSQFIRVVPKLMSDNITAAPQSPVSSSDVGEQTSTLQGPPAAPIAPVQPTTTSGTAQSGVSNPQVVPTGMDGSTSVPTTSNAPPPTSSNSAATTTEPSSAGTTSGEVRLPHSLSAATSKPLAAPSAPTPLTPIPAALLQLAAAAGGSSATSLAASPTQTASTVQCTPALRALTRPVPRLGTDVLPALIVAQVSASIFDIRVRRRWWRMPDGLAHSVPVPHFSEGELARLSALGGVEAVSELLQANPRRPVNFSDAHVRLAAEREMLALARCYGVEGFASRVMNTTRLFALTKERDGHAATTQLLADERSRSQPQAPAAMTPAEADALKSEVNTLRSVAGRLSSEKSDLQDQLRIVTTKFAELQRNITLHSSVSVT
ncbi:unnamed protein product [Phytophthora fragariaefolia]|uniref:Unnamed protein product n=1 Tax=Phytophthora fragariaefolia TaxID=1490495 RepID=A0A9W6UB06_9STRA|nr:unnamed protein product [Phytophthora fragariaefolia]